MGALKSELDDLVERRNEVAHRAIPDEILSYERLLAKVSYVEAIALGLVASLAGILMKASIKNNECALLGTPTEYFRKNRVVIFDSLESSISEGDSILAPAALRTRWGRVLEIQLADKRVAQAHAGDEAGLLLDFAVGRGAALHLWNNPDADLTFRPDGIFGSQGPL
jgi:hypothetical protein